MFIFLKEIRWVKPGSIAGILRCWNKDDMVSKKEERWKMSRLVFGGQSRWRGTRDVLKEYKEAYRFLR